MVLISYLFCILICVAILALPWVLGGIVLNNCVRGHRARRRVNEDVLKAFIRGKFRL